MNKQSYFLPNLQQKKVLWFHQGSVYFASLGKSYAGVILPLVKCDWLKWSHDKYDIHKETPDCSLRLGLGYIFLGLAYSSRDVDKKSLQ